MGALVPGATKFGDRCSRSSRTWGEFGRRPAAFTQPAGHNRQEELKAPEICRHGAESEARQYVRDLQDLVPASLQNLKVVLPGSTHRQGAQGHTWTPAKPPPSVVFRMFSRHHACPPGKVPLLPTCAQIPPSLQSISCLREAESAAPLRVQGVLQRAPPSQQQFLHDHFHVH